MNSWGWLGVLGFLGLWKPYLWVLLVLFLLAFIPTKKKK